MDDKSQMKQQQNYKEMVSKDNSIGILQKTSNVFVINSMGIVYWKCTGCP